jgi:hypothetical protein
LRQGSPSAYKILLWILNKFDAQIKYFKIEAYKNYLLHCSLAG